MDLSKIDIVSVELDPKDRTGVINFVHDGDKYHMWWSGDTELAVLNRFLHQHNSPLTEKERGFCDFESETVGERIKSFLTSMRISS